MSPTETVQVLFVRELYRPEFPRREPQLLVEKSIPIYFDFEPLLSC